MKTSKSSGTFRPFEDLKALLRNKSFKLGSYSVEYEKARPKTGDRQHSVSQTADSKVVKLSHENEKKIFLEAMSGVKPIPREDRVEHNTTFRSPIGPGNDSEAETLLQLDNLIKFGKGFIVSDTPEYIEGTGYNVNPEFAKRLHRGDFSIQAHIDLHGLCVKDARNAFEKIVAQLHSFFVFLKSSYKTIILVAIVAIISIVSTTLVSIMLSDTAHDIYLPSLGTIKTLDVETYWDQNGENKMETLSWGEFKIETLNWGEIEVETLNTTVFVKSVSNFIVTLNIFLTDWNPLEISDYLTISWDYNGTFINPGEIIPVTMTLSASSSDAFIDYLVENEITRFDVVIHIVASD